MLYVTTRNNRDAYTVQRAISESRGPDGGMYLPFRAPELPQAAAEGEDFASAVAAVLNLLLRGRFTAWDISFAAGSRPVVIRQLPHRIAVAELWHNPGFTYEGLEQRLGALLLPGELRGWPRIALRAAVTCGVLAELRRAGIRGPELCMVAGDFSGPMAARYARDWGAEIGEIVCVCNENQELWSLLRKGQLRTDAVSRATCVPQADIAVPEELERLIREAGGPEEVGRYLEQQRCGGTYCPGEAVLERLRRGLSVSVVSARRTESTIPSAYATHGVLLSPEGALAYGGLLDYRANTGRNGWAAVLEERSPLADTPAVAKAMGVPEETLRSLVKEA